MQLQDTTKQDQLNHELTVMAENMRVEQDQHTKTLEQKNAEIATLTQNLTEFPIMKEGIEKFERELKNKVEELKEMSKLVERLQQSEKEFVESKSAIEIARKKEENLIEELKKTKDKEKDLLKSSEDLARNLQDLQIKLKESELLLASKDAKIQELEIKASRVVLDSTGIDFAEDSDAKLEETKPKPKVVEEKPNVDEEIAARFEKMRVSQR